MKILSKVPGRIRAKEDKIYRNQELSQLLNIYLKNLPGVYDSNVNPIIGTVVIYYDPQMLDEEELKSRIIQVLNAESPYLQHIHNNYQALLEEEDRLSVAQEKMLIFGGLYLLLKIKHIFFGKFSLSRSLPILATAAVISIFNGYPAFQRITQKLSEYFPSNPDKVLLGLGMILTILREGDGILFLFLKSFTEAIEANSQLQMKQVMLTNSPNPMDLVWYQEGEETHLVPSKSLQIGDQVNFSSNDTILMDGIVTQGEALVNCLYFTGQPGYQKVRSKDEVREGMVIDTGSITIQITELPTRTHKPDLNLEDLEITRLAKKYQRQSTYIATGLAALGYVLTGNVITPLATFLVMNPATIQVSLSSGITNYLKLLLKNKILLRNVNTLEKIINTSKIVFDKTGTLTDGHLQITQIDSLDPDYTNEEILELCANCVADRFYPVTNSNEQRIYLPVAGTECKRVGNNEIGVHTRAMLVEQGIQLPVQKQGLTSFNQRLADNQNQSLTSGLTLYISKDQQVIGQIHLTEKIEANVPQAITQLRELGLEEMAIISGDQASSVQRVAEALQLSEYHSQLTKTDKARYIAREKETGPLIMVGDGINDAEAMESADVSISYQRANSQVVLSSDCILLDKDLTLIPKLLELTEESYQTIEKNLKFSWYYSIFFGAVSSLGYLTLFQAEAIKTFNLINSILSSGTISKLDAPTLKEVFAPISFEKLNLWDQEQEAHFLARQAKEVQKPVTI